MFILKNHGKNKDVLLGYLKMGTWKSAPGGPSVASLVPFLLPSSGLPLSWVRQVFTVRQVFFCSAISECIPMPFNVCFWMCPQTWYSRSSRPSQICTQAWCSGLSRSKPLSFPSVWLLCFACQQREVSGIITFTRCNAAYLACVCYRCSCLQSCYDIPDVRAVCHLTNRGFLTKTAVFSLESFILTYTNAE